eukprot:COSAG02_NODE_45532_length_356_cov_0.813230_1_plen_25_part_10
MEASRQNEFSDNVHATICANENLFH